MDAWAAFMRMDDLKFQLFSSTGDPFKIEPALVSHLTAAWKIPIVVEKNLYLSGCTFHLCDYENDPILGLEKLQNHIFKYGGEVASAYSSRVTHLICKTLKSKISQQARSEGKRLAAIYWMKDIASLKAVSPPWKALHFPLSSSFDKNNQQHLTLSVTEFTGPESDWVKEMIKISGAKYTNNITRDTDAIVCKRYHLLVFRHYQSTCRFFVSSAPKEYGQGMLKSGMSL